MTITLTREEAQQVLDALYGTIAYDYHGKPLDEKDTACDKAADVIEARLAHPEPEPVAWYWSRGVEFTIAFEEMDGHAPLYLHPPQREWQGLTDEERYLGDARSEEEIEYAKAIEAKLKEKNA
jgi:hypothetical protein